MFTFFSLFTSSKTNLRFFLCRVFYIIRTSIILLFAKMQLNSATVALDKNSCQFSFFFSSWSHYDCILTKWVNVKVHVFITVSVVWVLNIYHDHGVSYVDTICSHALYNVWNEHVYLSCAIDTKQSYINDSVSRTIKQYMYITTLVKMFSIFCCCYIFNRTLSKTLYNFKHVLLICKLFSKPCFIWTNSKGF